jgi:membrane protein implicated in regulation of membrane protease activity
MTQRVRVRDGTPQRRAMPLWFVVVGAGCAVASLVLALVAGSPWWAVLSAAGVVAVWIWYVVLWVRRPREPGQDT